MMMYRCCPYTQLSWSESGNCILWLFQGAAVDTLAKYVFTLIGTFAIGVCTELLRYYRTSLPRYVAAKFETSPFAQDALQALAYGVQMIFAYAMMLLVMTYESLLIGSVLFGLAVGFFITLRLQRAEAGDGAAAGALHVPLIVGGHSPCCDGGCETKSVKH